MTKQLKTISALLLVALATSGCVGYRVGSMLPADIRTVYVPTFANETTEPLLEVATTRAVITRIQQDGSLKIAGPEEADALLSVTIVRFDLQALAFEQQRRAAADEYRMYITANVRMTRQKTGETISEIQGVTGEATFLITGDMTSSKQTAYPKAADDLAHLIVQQLVEYW